MRVLIIGTLAGQIGTAARLARAQGAQVIQADDLDTGLRSLRAGEGAQLVLVDVRFEIAILVEQLQAERISVPVIACGTGTDRRAAVAAIKAGAREYLPLPPEAELISAIFAAIARDEHALVHADARTAAVLRMAERIAPSDASVLILGPSGTGKELIARFVHAHSRRKAGRFVAVNCAAIPETLLESELFGHEKGAFTGAVARRVGRFEEACGGTLLLDEISEMDVRLQAKLLRAIQEREIDRVGGTTPVKVDVRILATSNRNLQDEVAKGHFRADLYFRLNVVTLSLPRLADRPADIPVLARHFVERYAAANGLGAMRLSADALALLGRHRWPGNVRELENAMHRAVLLASGPEIGTDSILLGFEPAGASADAGADAGAHAGAGGAPVGGVAGGLVGRTVADVERDLIIDTLRHCLGNRTQAAGILGISIRTMRNKLRQYVDEGCDVPPPGETPMASAAPMMVAR